jgi:chromosome partitioning protein
MMQPIDSQQSGKVEVISSNAELPVAPRSQKVRRVLVVNAKGGCGKTTIATNLASYYASRGFAVTLADHDPQGSSTQWLSLRSDDYPSINGVAAYRKTDSAVTRTWQLRAPVDTDRMILDAPAGVHGMTLVEMVREADTIIIPVLPSPIDIHAASHFIKDLLLVAKVRARSIRLGVVANRVRSKTKVYQSLQRFLNSLQIPFVAYLRDTQNYVQSSESGLGVYEWAGHNIRQDRRQWDKLVRWIEEEAEPGSAATQR